MQGGAAITVRPHYAIVNSASGSRAPADRMRRAGSAIADAAATAWPASASPTDIRVRSTIWPARRKSRSRKTARTHGLSPCV